MSITVLVINKNGAAHLVQHLPDLKFADELVVVDIKSTDESLKIAKQHANRVISYPKDSAFVEPVRNFALAQVTGDWVLVLDADETISPALSQHLQDLSRDSQVQAVYLPRQNLVCGAWMRHTGWWPDYQLRFFRLGVISWTDKIHSQPLYQGRALQAERLRRQPPEGLIFAPPQEEWAILHHNYQNINEYLERLNRYTSIEAQQAVAQLNGEIDSFTINSTGLIRAFKDEWLRRFFAKEAYKDGARGLYLSLAQALYQMTVKMKTWDLLHNRPEFEKENDLDLGRELSLFLREYKYWLYDLKFKQSKGVLKYWYLLCRKFLL